MGRIFEKRKHKIFARNAKLSKLFTRIGKEIAMAVKAGGPNPDANSRLKVAIQNARGMNMPKDNVDRAIKKVKGNGSRKIVVFSDPDCPFCKRIEQEFEKMTDVTIYVLLYPIEQLHAKAPERSRAIWCSPNRLKAWEDYMLRGTAPTAIRRSRSRRSIPRSLRPGPGCTAWWGRRRSRRCGRSGGGSAPTRIGRPWPRSDPR